MLRFCRLGVVGLLTVVLAPLSAAAAEKPLKIATFEIDTSPPVGSPLAYDPCERIESPLSCCGN